jgi:hypothetical protein
MFFSLLPNIEFSQKRNKYRFTEQDFIVAKNIFREFTVDNSAYATDLFAEFLIADGARPDYIAELLYKDAGYDWVILLTNKVINLYNDWPLTSKEFEEYVFSKYENPLDIKHWQTIEVKNDLGEIVQPKGIIVYYDPSNPESYTLKYVKSYNPLVEEIDTGNNVLESVSYYEYEQMVNEKKRTIQILKPTYLQQFVKLFKISTGYLPNEQLTNDANLKKTLNTSNIFTNISL